MSYLKNTTGQHLYFTLIDASDGSAITSGIVTGRRSIDGGTQATTTGTISTKGNGQWEIALSQADTNGDEIGFLFTHADAIPVSISIVTDTKKVGSLNDLTAAQVNAEADAALADYDPPTKAELDTAVSPLATAANQTTIIDYVDELETRLTAARAALLDNLDAAITTRLASSSYTDPDNASITAVLADTDFLQILLAELITGTTPNRAYTAAALANAPSGSTSINFADFFDTDSGETAGTAVTGSVVGEIVASITAGGIPGSVEVDDIQINDGTNPIEGAAVWITTDANGQNVAWSGTTDTNGYAKASDNTNPFLDPGAYYIWVQLSGYTFNNPTTKVIS